MADNVLIARMPKPEPAWIDHYPENALQQLLSALPSVDVYALVDNAFDTRLAQRLSRRFPGLPQQSLYAGRYDGPGLAEIAPATVRIPDEASERRAFLALALRETSGKPMLSFLRCTSASRDPALHLQNQMEAVDHEGTEFLVRFADTRSLDTLLQVFDDAQRERFLAGIQWWYFRRDGSLQQVSHTGGATDNLADDPYVLSQVQMSRFDTLARPDGVLRLVQTNPHWLGQVVGTPSQAHACIRAALDSSDIGVETHDATVVRLAAGALMQAGLLQSSHHQEQPQDSLE